MTDTTNETSWQEAGQGGPGIILCHAWWGLSEGVRAIGESLADAGFLVVMPDLYAGQTTRSIEEANQLRQAFPSDVLQDRFDAAVQHLLDHPDRQPGKIGAVGLSLGAEWALGLVTAQPAEVPAVVVYYGASEPDGIPGEGLACLGHWAENDDYEDDEYIVTLRDGLVAAGADVTFHTYPGTGHWFAESDVPTAYDPAAASVAMDRTIAFFREHLQPSNSTAS